MSIRFDIRKRIIAERKQIDFFTQQNCSLKICQRFLELSEYIHCEHIASYIANNGEVDPKKILEDEMEKKHYLPIFDPSN